MFEDPECDVTFNKTYPKDSCLSPRKPSTFWLLSVSPQAGSSVRAGLEPFLSSCSRVTKQSSPISKRKEEEIG